MLYKGSDDVGEKNSNIRTKTAGALYPISDISNDELEPYKTYLDKALEDEEIKNIAISAPYGGGKTSILLSYFNKNVDKSKYQFITLPNFFEDSEQLTEEELQEKIIEQLLYRADPKDLPYSKINRISDKPYWQEALEFISIIIALLFSFLFLNNLKKLTFNEFKEIKFDATTLLIILLFVLIWLGATFFYRIFKVKFTGSTVDIKSNLINVSTVEQKEVDNLKTFSRFSEEILYYFRAMNTKFIVFEDLDRFKNPKIFQDLRELNTNINKQFIKEKNKKNVVFIYSLRDSIFVPEIDNKKAKESEKPLFSPNDKAKFFDYILPVFPNTDYYNSSRLFIEEFKHHNEQFYKDIIEESEQFKNLISDIGYFINDYRIIKLITQEFFVYKKNINKNSPDKEKIDYYKLFAMVIYKNFNPEDFEKINKNNSNLHFVFNGLSLMLDRIINKESEIIEKNIKKLTDERDTISEFLEFDLDILLKMEYEKILRKNNTNYLKIENKNYTDHKSFYNILEKIDSDVVINNPSNRSIGKAGDFFITSETDRDLTPIISAYNDNIKVPSMRISEIDRKIFNLSHEKNGLHYNLRDYSSGRILSEFLSLESLRSLNSKNNQLDTFKILDNLNDISRMLLVNDYISDDFIRYISPVKYSSDESDSDFIGKVINRHKFKNDQRLNDPKHVLEVFKNRETHQIYMYSSDIVSQEINPTLRIEIIENVVNNQDYKFIYNLFSQDKNNTKINKVIFEYLVMVHKDFFRDFIIKYSDNISFLLYAFDRDYLNVILTESSELKNSLSKVFNQITDNSVLYNLFNFLSTTKNLDITKFSNGLKIRSSIKDFIEINKESIDIEYKILNLILKYDLFSGSYKDFKYLREKFKMDSIFSGFINKINELNVKKFNVELFSKYLLDQYNNSKNYETYSSFNLFLDYALNSEDINHELFSDFSKEISDNDVLNSYKNIRFEENIPEETAHILKKIKLNEKIEKKIIDDDFLIELIINKKINYSLDFIEILSKNYDINNKPITLYLKYAYQYEQEEFIKSYNIIEADIDINVKLFLFSVVKLKDEKEMILESMNHSFEEILPSSIEFKNFSKMLDLQINKKQIIEFMYYSQDKQVRLKGLDYILSKNVMVNSKELDYALNTDFFEKTTKDGNDPKYYENEMVLKEYIELLAENNYAKIDEDDKNKFAIYARFKDRFPDLIE